ncbi:FMN reductase [Microbacterium protaetiae]|uniref:FMN reductase n=1 Tax=Microbacterium protaetiae TaxID=2509458 RepID=A0A4P6EHJ8_9MICO|nr:NAD(P)H-dependent oxidoreductase [Microbacterium protaetiae]QAY59587.1 FMN reductase [Microbacterium protaetiae]
MSTTLQIVAVSGSLRAPSTTNLLLEAVLDEIERAVPVERQVLELRTLAVDLARALTAGAVSAPVLAAQQAVAEADIVVVGTPIYRGAYTGLFKDFFDLLHHDALADTPVLLTAGGGNDQHSLAIDHELRPLFAFFRAHTLPIGVYARSADFAEGRIIGTALPAAVTRAVEAALPVLKARAAASPLSTI